MSAMSALFLALVLRAQDVHLIARAFRCDIDALAPVVVERRFDLDVGLFGWAVVDLRLTEVEFPDTVHLLAHVATNLAEHATEHDLSWRWPVPTNPAVEPLI